MATYHKIMIDGNEVIMSRQEACKFLAKFNNTSNRMAKEMYKSYETEKMIRIVYGIKEKFYDFT